MKVLQQPDSVSREDLAANPPPTRRERFWVLGLILALLGFNLATYNLYPIVWIDEVTFSEPAVNLVKYGSFTTTVWQFAPPDTFPTVNCPLYPMAQVPWLAVTGSSILAVRSFNYVMMALATWLLWLVSWRFSLIKTAGARLLMLAVLPFGYGMSFAYRCSRPDMIAMVCLLLTVLSFQIKPRRQREACLFVLAATLVWIGLQVALFAWCGCTGAWLLLRRTGMRELVIVSLGMATGATTMMLFFSWHGVLSWFLPPIVGLMGRYYAHETHISAGAAVVRVFKEAIGRSFTDFSTLPMLMALVILLGARWNALTAATRALAVYAVALFFGIPLVFSLVGHYAFYYSYLRYVPLLLALIAVYAELSLSPAGLAPWMKGAFVAMLAVAVAVGLPMRLAITLASCKLTQRAELERIVRANITRQDIVFSDWAIFFEVKGIARRVYDKNYSTKMLPTTIQGHDFTKAEKQSITVLAVRASNKDTFTKFFGGNWRAVTEPFGDTQDFSRLVQLPVVGPRLASYAAQPQNERYQVQILRRVE